MARHPRIASRTRALADVAGRELLVTMRRRSASQSRWPACESVAPASQAEPAEQRGTDPEVTCPEWPPRRAVSHVSPRVDSAGGFMIPPDTTGRNPAG